MDADRASRTAVLVCQGRAAAHGRIAEGRFADPTATALLRDGERVAVQRVREGVPPNGWRERVEFEMVRASSEVIVPRTVAIDDAVRARSAPQLVIVGAGLDDRAWRMPELADVKVFEVDHPASQQDKRSRVAGLRPLARSVRFVPVDFTRDRLETALASAGHRADQATTWVWEGVVPYLTPAEVAATVQALSGRSAADSRLVVNYQSPALSAALGRLVARAMTATARQRSPWADEPRRSSWRPAAMSELLARHGFRVDRDDDLLTLAEDLSVPVRQRQSLQTGRVAVADR
jgi:methyltransferase (TIGR00027 family)